MNEQNNKGGNGTPNKKSKIGIIIGAVCIIAIVTVIILLISGSNSKTSNHTHVYDEWKIIKDASCITEGTKERYCSCGEKQTSAIATIEHTYTEWITVTESTCNQNGIKKRTCSVCDHEEEGKLELSTNHTYGDWSTKVPATCDATGIKSRKCSVCNKEETDTLEKISHNVNATTGKCTYCDAQISNPQIELTTSNIYDYIQFVAASENVVITDQSSLYTYNEKGDGSVRVTATRLQNVTFHNVKLVISLETSSRGWGTMYNREITVPFDGNINSIFSIHSDIASKVSPTPTYRVVVTSVSGYVTMN